MPDSGWLKALDTAKRYAPVVFAIAVLANISPVREWFHIDDLPGWGQGIIGLFGLAGLCFVVDALARRAGAKVKELRAEARERRAQQDTLAEQERERLKGERKTLARLDHVESDEREALSYLVQTGRQSTCAVLLNATVMLKLVGKELLRLEDDDGTCPKWERRFSVPDFVWHELRRRRNEFNTADPTMRAPWIVSWGVDEPA